MLELAAQQYEEFVAQKGDDPAVRLEQGRTRLRLGSIYRLLGRRDQAVDSLQSAQEMLRGLFAEAELKRDAMRSWELAKGLSALVAAEAAETAAADTQFAAAIAPLEEIGPAQTDEVEQREMAFGRHPGAVGRFVLTHQQERLLWIALRRHPLDRNLRHHVGAVPVATMRAMTGDQFGVVVGALAGQDFPMVEAGRLAFQMPLADNGCLITGLLEQLGKGLLSAVEAVSIAPWLCFPVSTTARLGPQRALVQKQFSNSIPSRANWSRLGVGAASLSHPP